MSATVLHGAASGARRQFFSRRQPPVRLGPRPEPGQGEEHAEPQVSHQHAAALKLQWPWCARWRGQKMEAAVIFWLLVALQNIYLRQLYGLWGIYVFSLLLVQAARPRRNAPFFLELISLVRYEPLLAAK